MLIFIPFPSILRQIYQFRTTHMPTLWHERPISSLAFSQSQHFDVNNFLCVEWAALSLLLLLGLMCADAMSHVIEFHSWFQQALWWCEQESCFFNNPGGEGSQKKSALGLILIFYIKSCCCCFGYITFEPVIFDNFPRPKRCVLSVVEEAPA